MLDQKQVEILLETQVLKYLKARSQKNNDLDEYYGAMQSFSIVLHNSSLSKEIHKRAERTHKSIYKDNKALRLQLNKAAVQSAFWWAEKLDEKYNTRRYVFAENLASIIERELNKFPYESRYEIILSIECDYDPDVYLQEALQRSSIPYKNTFFSSDGILPAKHLLVISPELIEGKEGYALPIIPVLI
jgi:hypothetical protein